MFCCFIIYIYIYVCMVNGISWRILLGKLNVLLFSKVHHRYYAYWFSLIWVFLNLIMVNELKSPLQNKSVLFEVCLNTKHQLVGEHLGCGIFRLNRLNYNSQENQWSCNFSYYWKVRIVMLLVISCTTKHMTQKRFHCNDASHPLDYCNIF